MVRAEQAFLTGRPEDAAPLVAQARLPGIVAWTLGERALALADSGQPPLLLQALAALDDLGAVPAAALVRHRLRRLGVRSSSCSWWPTG